MKKTILLLLFILPTTSFANGWSLNLGYNNPPGASVGLNFMYLWQKWAFEIGAGSAKVKDSNNTDVSVLAGDIDLKYLFGSGGFRPYLQAGTFYNTNTGNNNASVSVGGSSYMGVGFFGMGNSVYGYTSYNVGGGTGYFQIGIGFEL